jgi:hypothetical protein
VLGSVLVLSACAEKTTLTVTGLRPSVGPYIGGDPVIVTGSGFQSPGPQGLKVYFGKKAAKQVVILSGTEIRVDPPAGEIGQVVDVDLVFDDARQKKLPGAYTYIDPTGTPHGVEALTGTGDKK